MSRQLCVLLCASVLVAGCAGRTAVPVSAYQPNDNQMSCREVDSEIQRNNEALRVRVQEGAETEKRNIAVGAAAILLFWPAAFAMDFKDAAGTEAMSLEQRNATLTQLAAKQRCRTTHAMTVAEAEAERVAREVAERRMSEENKVTGVTTPTDPRLRQASQPTATAVRQASAAEPGLDRSRLRDLMDRFLRGEISKAEYERLRAG